MTAVQNLIEILDRNGSILGVHNLAREALPELRELAAKVERYEAWLRGRLAKCDEATDNDLFGINATVTKLVAAELRELLGEQ